MPDRFSEQHEFLRAVGRQRLQTTNPEDLIEVEEESLQELMENQSVLNEIEEREIFLDHDGKFLKIKSIANLSMQIKQYRKRNPKRLPWHITKQYPVLDQFIIILFSKVHYIWLVIMLICWAYTLFIVPFWISLEYSLSVWLIPFDILSLILLMVDIFITSRTAFDKNFDIIIDLKSTVVDCIDTKFFIDICAVLPINYILLIFRAKQQVIAFTRALRLPKLYKPINYIRA